MATLESQLRANYSPLSGRFWLLLDSSEKGQTFFSISRHLFLAAAFWNLRHSYSKYLLMKFFLFDEVSGPCNSLSTLLAVLQDNIFLQWSFLRTKAASFPPGLVEIKLRTEKDLNLTLAAIIICPFGFLFVSLECVCRSNLRVKSWL